MHYSVALYLSKWNADVVIVAHVIKTLHAIQAITVAAVVMHEPNE